MSDLHCHTLLSVLFIYLILPFILPFVQVQEERSSSWSGRCSSMSCQLVCDWQDAEEGSCFIINTKSEGCDLRWPLTSSYRRSQSVIRIYTTVRFEPSKINIFVKDCQRGGKDVTCMSAIVCFNVTARTAISPTQEIGKSAITILGRPRGAGVSPCRLLLQGVDHLSLFLSQTNYCNRWATDILQL